MEATRAYPNCPPVVLRRGFTGSLALPSPECVPLEPLVLDEARLRARGAVAVDAVGAMRLHVRNRDGYSFLRPRQDQKMREGKMIVTQKLSLQPERYKPHITFLQHQNLCLPEKLIVRRLLEVDLLAKSEGPISKRQSNAITGISLASDASHVVFFPTGQILQRACAFFSSNDDIAHPNGGFTSNAVETGTVIRQFAVMGHTNDYRPFGSESIMVAARGEANCTILSVTTPSSGEQKPRMRTKTKLTFTESVSHITASPHTETELAFITSDGIVHYWEPDSGLQVVTNNFSGKTLHVTRCEYSSHPCVLWAASKKTVATMDLRSPTSNLHNTATLFDISAVSSPFAEIYGLKRRSRSPFQFIVASGLATEIIDSRMARLPLISWERVQADGADSIGFGAVEELDMGAETSDDRGAVVTISSHPKVATLYPFERSQKRPHKFATLSLQPLRYNDEDGERADMCASQYVTADAPLDLHMHDGGEFTQLMGICPLRDGAEASSARVYQLNNIGDLYSHRVAWSAGSKTKSYGAAIQTELPCGIAAQDVPSSSRGLKRKLPIPVDAILPEFSADTLLRFNTLTMRLFYRKYPRVKKVETAQSDDPDVDQPSLTEISDDDEVVAEELHRVCQPSATLFQLHRYLTDKMGMPCSSRELLRFLSVRAEFAIQTAQYQHIRKRKFRVVNARDPANGENREHESKDDPRLSTCQCSTESSLWPCESLACILPHALVVSSRMDGISIDSVIPKSMRHPAQSPEYAKIIKAAREAFNRSESST